MLNIQSINNEFSGCILKQLTVSLWKLVVDFFRIGCSKIDAMLSNITSKWGLDGPRRFKNLWTWAMLPPVFTIFCRPSRCAVTVHFSFFRSVGLHSSCRQCYFVNCKFKINVRVALHVLLSFVEGICVQQY